MISLRTRLFLILLVVNLALLLVAQLTGFWLQRSWLENNRRYYESQVNEVLRGVVRNAVGEDPESYATAIVRRMLDPAVRSNWPRSFRDVLITSGDLSQAAVALNPMGAIARDPESFPLAEIREGIRDAIRERSLVRVDRGFCVPISVGDAVIGGAWVEPLLPAPPQVPFAVFGVPVLVGTLVFASLAFWLLNSSVFRPIEQLSAAAARVGAGDYAARVERVRSTRELDRFIAAFNAMAERIHGHQRELEREVRLATAEAQRRERAMLQSARLAAIGTLAAGIAHEINNPIGGMVNAIRRLEKLDDLGERDRLYIRLIREGLDRVGAITRRLLDFSPRQIDPEPFRLVDAIEGARALVDHRLRRQAVDFVVDVPADLPPLIGDLHEFQQVLLNLAINSLDVLEGRPEPRRIVARGRRATGSAVEVVVEDNGPGMDPADLPRVIDPFFSKKGRPDASGLGMFISYSIIQNLGGEMEVDSAPGQGFRVTIRLPASMPAEDPSAGP